MVIFWLHTSPDQTHFASCQVISATGKQLSIYTSNYLKNTCPRIQGSTFRLHALLSGASTHRYTFHESSVLQTISRDIISIPHSRVHICSRSRSARCADIAIVNCLSSPSQFRRISGKNQKYHLWTTSHWSSPWGSDST